MVVRAHSTEITAHPITQALDKAMAKNAVNLEVPEKTALIRAGDRTVLAAIPYRQGRVVVSSFAQWFHPDPDYTGMPHKDSPVERGDEWHFSLLRNVVSWLAEPGHDGQTSAAAPVCPVAACGL